jgi:hypothetical protein
MTDMLILHLMDDDQRRALMVRITLKEQLAELREKGKISPEEYIEKVNALRAAEHLPPLPHEHAT